MLVGAGVAEVARASVDRPPPRWPAWAVAAMLATGPDADIILGLLLGRGGAFHGTFTHSITATAAVGVLAWAMAGWRWGVVAGAGYGSHLVVDLLDDTGPTNLMLGWPFTEARPYSIGRLFPRVNIEGNGAWDTGMNLLADRAEMIDLALQTGVGAAVFGVLLLVAAAIRRARGVSGAGR